MTAISVERIKLFSTRSPYWCLLMILVAGLGFALIIGLADSGRAATMTNSQAGTNLGMMVFMVLSALAVTTEYRFGTIRTTLLAQPNRTTVLLSKTILVAVIGAVVGAITSLASFYLTKAVASTPPRPLELSTGEDWRIVVGHAALFAIAAVIAVAIGTLVRQSAGAIAIALLWPLLLENLLGAIPSLNEASRWFPFHAADRFVSPTTRTGIDALTGSSEGPTPVQGLLVFIGTAAVLWIISLVVLKRRDA